MQIQRNDFLLVSLGTLQVFFLLKFINVMQIVLGYRQVGPGALLVYVSLLVLVVGIFLMFRNCATLTSLLRKQTNESEEKSLSQVGIHSLIMLVSYFLSLILLQIL